MNTRAPLTYRPAAVAGMFYPADPGQLTAEISAMLTANPCTVDEEPKALIVPHAGYIYSGPVAAGAYNLIAGLKARIRRVVLLGPTHRVAVRGLGLPTCDAFATPLGLVPLDKEAAAQISHLPQVVPHDACHAQEHSLEVQLPFLQSVLENFRLLPLAVGMASPEQVAQVLDCLWGGPETLILISSDLSHFLPYQAAKDMDQHAARRILTLDGPLNHEQACGATPVNGLLLCARQRGMSVRMLDLRNSGDTAGSRAQVVGYGSFAFFPPQTAALH